MRTCWECDRNGAQIRADFVIADGPDAGIALCGPHASFETVRVLPLPHMWEENQKDED